MRTAEGLGVQKIHLTGYSPYPKTSNDTRLPHIAISNHTNIIKTSLGAEHYIEWQHSDDVASVIHSLKSAEYSVYALEQADSSIPLPTFDPPRRIAILLGEEVNGIPDDLLTMIPDTIEIPMFGKKESFNVVEAATMAMYHCRFHT